jgi:excisionase family DNA binding protein
MTTTDKKRDLINAGDAAAYLGITRDSLHVMRSRGDLPIPYYRVGRRRIMFDRADLDAYLSARRVEPASAV